MAAASVVLIVLGVLTRRSDVAVLAVPMVLTLTWTWIRRPTAVGVASLRASDRLDQPGMRQPGTITAFAEIAPGSETESVLLRASAPGHRPAFALLATPTRRSVAVSMNTVRTGRRALLSVDVREAGPEHQYRTDAVTPAPAVITILPAALPLRELPLPFRLQGLTGPHSWRRAGDGGDLHDVAVFAPGDRLRRIDWRATVRRAGQGRGAVPGMLTELYVRRTFTTADATVMLVLDSRDDVGPRVATWGDAGAQREDEATSLDLARQAGVSLARRYLEGGDRVGLEDLGRIRRPVPPAGGRQHLQRLAQRLALAQPEGEPKPRKRVPRLPSGALIIVFSTFLDDDVALFAQVWRGAGHRVLAVDVLPHLVDTQLSTRLAAAYRLISMERTDRIRALERGGIEVVRWDTLTTDGSRADDPEVVLVGLARRRARR